jgi:hypothetical protein
MPHLIDSDGNIYTGDPVIEAQARERTQYRKHIPQEHWELPEMTIQEAVRMQWNGPTNQRIQELRLAGSQSVRSQERTPRRRISVLYSDQRSMTNQTTRPEST